MQSYLEGTLEEVPDDMSGLVASPAAEHLFTVRDDPTMRLDDKRAELFHHIAIQLLFVCKRARPDLQTAISFLCTRVKNPNEDDYKKLARVIKYV